MRLLIDARKLGHGGIGTYVSNLVSGLLESGKAEVTLILQTNADPGTWRDQVRVIHDDSKPYSLNELFLMPRRIRWTDFDLFHEPHFTLPFFIPIPSIVTIHDLIHINQAERWFYPLISGNLIRSSLKRAAQIIAVSEATHAEILNFTGHESPIIEKLQVIPNSYDPQWRRSDVSKFNFGAPYFLSICSTDKPHKGAKSLIEGFKIFKSQCPRHDRIKLVIAGQGVTAAPHTEDLILLNNLPPGDLIDLYSNATALIVSSLAEGFCLPALEAQVLHTPVISTPLPAVRSLLGPRDSMLEGFSSRDIANGLETFMDQSVLRSEIHFDYANHLSRYSRTYVTSQILDLYRATLRSSL